MRESLCADATAAIGNTPVVALTRFGRGLSAKLFGKCEFMNPGGSIKDRIALYMVQQAEARGELQPGGTIIEATAGNTGVALAMVAALRGYRFLAVMTSKASAEKVDVLRAYGAKVVICPSRASPGDPQHFIERARVISQNTSGAWCANQFDNVDNVAAHYTTTGPELYQQSGGHIDVLVGGIGTGGTLAGTAAYLKERLPHLHVVLADPQGSLLGAARNDGVVCPNPYLVEGIGGDFVPENARLDLVDEVITVGDAQSAKAMLACAKTEGLLVGASAGCILAAAQQYGKRECTKDQRVMVFLPDGGRSYLSTFYNASWRQRCFAEAENPVQEQMLCTSLDIV